MDRSDDALTVSDLDVVGEIVGKTTSGKKYDVEAAGDALVLKPVDGDGTDIVTTPGGLFRWHQDGEVYFPETVGEDLHDAIDQLKAWDGDA